jgi:hypothetical protein
MASAAPYTPPPWAVHAACIPRSRLTLIRTQTPLHAWALDVPDGFTLWVKRDDQTDVGTAPLCVSMSSATRVGSDRMS